MERKDLTGEVWESFPAEFREMCLVISSNNSDYCVPGVINYLLDKRKEVEDPNCEVSHYRFALWVDHFFSTCLYPLEGRKKAWLTNMKSIHFLLRSYEDMLGDLFQYDRINKGHREEDMIVYQCDLTCLSQRLNVYFYTYYQFANNKTKCKERMATILADSNNNISYLLTHENAAMLFSREWIEDDDFYYPGIEYWQEPMSWLYHDVQVYEHEYGLLSSYAEYVECLKKCEYRPENEDVRKKLIAIAIMRLTKLNERVIPDRKPPFSPMKWLKAKMSKDTKKDSKDISVDTAVKKSRGTIKRLLLLTAMLLIFYTAFIIQAIPVVHPRQWVIATGAVMIVGAPFLLYYTISSLKDLFAWFGFDDDSDEDDIDDIF